MASPAKLARVDKAIWALIFGGLFGIVLALAIVDANTAAAWWLGIPGGLAVAVGVALILVRSRMEPDADRG